MTETTPVVDPDVYDQSPLDEDERYDRLTQLQRDALVKMAHRWKTLGPRSLEICGQPVKRGVWAGQYCKNPPGHNGTYEGWGPCFPHGGKRRRGRVEAGWHMAHAYAAQLNVSPWDALLLAVRIAAGKVTYTEHVLSLAKSDLELEGRVLRIDPQDAASDAEGRLSERTAALLIHPDTGEPLGVGEYRDLSWWVAKNEYWVAQMAKMAKMAVDAGVAAWQVQNAQDEAARIATVLNSVLEAMEGEIGDDAIIRMRSLLRAELLKMDERESAHAHEIGVADPDRAVVDSTQTWN